MSDRCYPHILLHCWLAGLPGRCRPLPSVCPSIHPSVRPSAWLPPSLPDSLPSWLAGRLVCQPALASVSHHLISPGWVATASPVPAAAAAAAAAAAEGSSSSITRSCHGNRERGGARLRCTLQWSRGPWCRDHVNTGPVSQLQTSQHSCQLLHAVVAAAPQHSYYCNTAAVAGPGLHLV